MVIINLHLNIVYLQPQANSKKLPFKSWTHLVGTFDGVTAKIYMNAVLLLNNRHQWEVIIGGSGTCTHFNGSINEVLIYNRALNTTEISILYN
jgi:hypothetical protein